MKIMCRKCGREFDPDIEMAECRPYFGHAPIKPSGQKLPEHALKPVEKKKQRPQFQSDFRMIWDE